MGEPCVKAIDRLGETKLMNCGKIATIIEYTSNKNMKVRFESGVVKRTSYALFKRGSVSERANSFDAFSHLGETRMMNCGKKATIISYDYYTDILVKFEDGQIVRTRYERFAAGQVDPSKKKEGIRTLKLDDIADEFGGNVTSLKKMQCGIYVALIEETDFDVVVKFKDGLKCRALKEQYERGIICPTTYFGYNIVEQSFIVKGGAPHYIIEKDGLRNIKMLTELESQEIL